MTEPAVVTGAAENTNAEGGRPPVLSDIQVEAIGRELGEPGWMIDARRSALEDYRRLPMPSPREDTWRHSDILQFPFGDLPLEVLAHSKKPKRAPAAWLKPLAAGEKGGRILLEDGWTKGIDPGGGSSAGGGGFPARFTGRSRSS